MLFLSQIIYLKKSTTDKLESVLKTFENHILETDRGRSLKSYLGDVKKFTNWFMEKCDTFAPNAITPIDLVEYREFLQKSGGFKYQPAKPSTVNRNLISLKIFFGWLEKTGAITINPIQDIKMVGVAGPTSPRWLNRNDTAAFVRAVQDHGTLRDLAMVMLMLHAGLRASEVCYLERSDLEISERKGQVTVRAGKGNKDRVVPINITARRVLMRYLEEHPSDPLFPGKHGKKKLTYWGLIFLIKDFAYIAKLDDITPHTLRHTFCKNLIDRGVPIDQVAMLAGHSSLDITKRYTTPSIEDLQSAVERAAWE